MIASVRLLFVHKLDYAQSFLAISMKLRWVMD